MTKLKEQSSKVCNSLYGSNFTEHVWNDSSQSVKDVGSMQIGLEL